MQKSFLKLLTTAVAVASLLTSTPIAFAQSITTTAVNGTVSDAQGNPVAGATVTIVHEPTGTRSTTVSHAGGQYNMSGLRIGGPYKITVAKAGLTTSDRSDVYLELDQSNVVDLSLSNEVLKLETFKVTGTQDSTFSSDKTSNNQTFSANDIAGMPMIRRDVQEIAVMDSRLSLTPNTSTGEFQLNAPGQNFRYNSFLVDGVQTNDAFGLNGNGFSSLRSPVPMDAIQALSIDLSPYDVRRSGFTGALLNAVIKSGTNEYHGSAYAYYTNQNMRGENPLTKTKDTFNERTWGITGGGPIIKDKLFFFVAYENFHRTAASPVSSFAPDAATLASIVAKLKTDFSYDAGSLSQDQTSQQTAYLAKLDWNINSDQRLSFTYRRTDGTAPIFADNNGFSNNTTIAAGELTLGNSFQASTSTHWYQQPRITDSYTLQLNSSWTSDLRTEATMSYAVYDGSPINNGTPFPELVFQNVTGKDLSTGNAVTNGQLFMGTERSRQYNFIDTKTFNANIFAEYTRDQHTFTVGADLQNDDVVNKFIQYALARYTFSVRSTDANYFLVPGVPNGTVRQAFLYGLNAAQAATLGIPLPPPDYTNAETDARFSMSNVGVYGQDVWRPSKNFSLTAGVRLDVPLISDRPVAIRNRGNANAPTATFSTTAFTEGGFEYKGRSVAVNTTNNNGNYTIAPRVGFSYKLPTKSKAQIRGGIGIFQGKNPTVWLSNMFSNTGAASNATPATGAGTNPVPFAPVTSLQTRVITQSVNVTDPDFKQPVSVKGNLAVDYTLPFDGLIATLNVDRAWVLKAPFVVDLNLGSPAAGLSGTLPDGRARLGGVRAASRVGFGNVLYLTDSEGGGSESYTFSLRRPMKNHWSYSVSYTHTHSTDVSPMTSSVAFSNYSQRMYTNPNENIASVSNYNTPDKLVISLSREFNFFNRQDALTRGGITYRGQTGHNYSWVFYNDVNGDGNGSGPNDLFYMPSSDDISSGKVVFTTTAQRDAFVAYAASVGLDKYAGKIVPRNSFTGKWMDTVDLHFSQQLPLSKKFGVEVYLDVLNFANMLDKSMGIVEGIDFPYERGIVSAASNATGTAYTYTFGQVQPLQVYTEASRWQVQLGARIKF